MFAAKNAAPMNSYPRWGYFLIVLAIILGVIYALPNIYGESNAVQISPKDGKPVTTVLGTQVQQILQQNNIHYTSYAVNTNDITIKFPDTDQQIKAQDDIQQTLGDQYSVAINLQPNTPKWLQTIGANPMKLGLDLRGGMYFLLDIDMQSVLDNSLQSTVSDLRANLRTQDIRYSDITLKPQGILVQLRTPDALTAAQTYIAKQYPTLQVSQSAKDPTALWLSLSPQEAQQLESYAADQTVQVMRNRVNELGVAEASVAKEGQDRVVIELPGVQDAARAKDILGGTATLQVMLVNEQADPNAPIPFGSTLYNMTNGQPVVLKNQVVLTGKSFVGANVGYDPQTNLPVVNVKLSGPEVSNFSQVTGENIQHLMAIVLIQQTFTKSDVNGKTVTKTKTDKQVISVATIQSQLGNNFQITGIGGVQEAQHLALMIRAGALPAAVQIVSEKQIGPTLGAQNIRVGEISIVVSMLLVMIFILFYYRVFGVIANIALILNIVFLFAIMSIIPGATLTLPGIAAVVLHVGMAIDCNVLIFERIREELRNGTPVQAAVHNGFTRAFATVVDSNVTTLIVAVILFAIGTGSIKGFAVVLIIGILTSMFTAVTVTRGLVNLTYGGRVVKRLSIGI